MIDSDARDLAERANTGVAEALITLRSQDARLVRAEMGVAEIVAQARVIRWLLAGILVALTGAMGLVWARVENQAQAARQVADIAAQAAVIRESTSCEARAKGWIDDAARAAIRARDAQIDRLTAR